MRSQALAAAIAAAAFSSIVSASNPYFVNSIAISGSATDLRNDVPPGANNNRLGGLFSDLYYDRVNDVYYGLPDRGAGGGVYDYDTRVQKFTLSVDPATGQISNFNLVDTILFKTADLSSSFTGIKPPAPAGSLGLSLDPEGFAVGPNGRFYVADEYGPSVYEFEPVQDNGKTVARFVRAFEVPGNLLPRDNNGNVNYSATRRVEQVPDQGSNLLDGIVRGRQDNRGYEGLTISPDGTKIYAILQDPLQEEGNPTFNGTTDLSLPGGDGRRSRNLRIVQYDIASGQSTGQFIYQLQPLSEINTRTPTMPFGGTSQGRNIGVSGIAALEDGRFLVIERDNRGVGADDPLGKNPVAHKRLYFVSLAGATDVSLISLAGGNDLIGQDPLNNDVTVIPASKTFFLDVKAALLNAGLPLTEKLEGITFGPKLNDGNYLLLLGTDNDYSVTQTGGNEQYDVYTSGTTVRYTPLDDTSRSYASISDPLNLVDLGPLPAGYALLPTYLYAFVLPEPGTLGLLALGVLPLLRRRRA